jgi:hypothetical protein
MNKYLPGPVNILFVIQNQFKLLTKILAFLDSTNSQLSNESKTIKNRQQVTDLQLRNVLLIQEKTHSWTKLIRN